MSIKQVWLCGLCVLAGLGGVGSAWAEGALSVPETDEGYLIGASLASSSSHVGNGKASFTLKPIPS